jgi:hypothetical protein
MSSAFSSSDWKLLDATRRVGDDHAHALARGDTEEYDQARENVGWDRDVPTGAKLHVSGFSEDGLHVLDVWESELAFNTFMEQRLGPLIATFARSGSACRLTLAH